MKVFCEATGQLMRDAAPIRSWASEARSAVLEAKDIWSGMLIIDSFDGLKVDGGENGIKQRVLLAALLIYLREEAMKIWDANRAYPDTNSGTVSGWLRSSEVEPFWEWLGGPSALRSFRSTINTLNRVELELTKL